ncbi:hypothetical protein ACP4OV_011776 [Aristida adscensionis]
MEGVGMGVAGAGRSRGGGGEESDDASSGGVELSLGLATGSCSLPAAAAAAKEEAATEEAARRSMTIFYNGRVCTADVTEIQARAIISMASQELLGGDRHRPRGDDDRRRQQDNSDSGSSSSGGGHLRPPAAAASPAGTPRQQQGGLAVAAAAPAIGHAASTGLSMKRSLQRFLQKRKARVGDAAAPPYAGGRHAQAQAMRH